MTPPAFHPFRPPARQSGIVLFIALMAIAVMAFAALALMRSSGTSSTIAGNLSFQQAATQAADTGIELAYDALRTITAGSQNISNQRAGYSAVKIGSDSDGLPNGIDWASLPCKDPFDPEQQPSCSEGSASGYLVRYYIDRQCTGTLPIVDFVKDCLTEDKDKPDQPDSHAIGHQVFTRSERELKVLYRVTVQVRGPRGTETFVQAVMAF